MGLMGYLFGQAPQALPGTGGNITEGQHNINKDVILRPTDGAAPSPTNIGTMSSIRTVPVLDDPRYFSPEEAQALEKLAKQKKKGALASIDAYAAMRKIDNCDVIVHKEHRRYQRKLANNESEKKAADVRYGNRLHALRGKYAEMGTSLEAAEKKADQRVAIAKSKYDF